MTGSANRTKPALKPLYARILVILGLLAVWELLGHFADPLFFSPLSRSFVAGLDIFQSAQLRSAVWLTFIELAIAFALSVVFGVIIAVMIGATTRSYRNFFPIVMFLYAIPQITILPLFVLYFGPGPESKIAFGFSHGIFPVIITVVGALRGLDPLLLRSAYSMGASRTQIFRRITLPFIIPGLFTGMRLGMTACLLGVILGELYVSTGGIGAFTRQYTDSLRPDRLFALTVVLALLAILINETLRRAEIRVSHWRRA